MDTRTNDRDWGKDLPPRFTRPPAPPNGPALKEDDSIWVAAYAAAVRAQACDMDAEYPDPFAKIIKDLGDKADALPQPFSLKPINKR